METGEYSKWPYFEDREINLIGDILRSGRVNYWTGDYNKRFEEQLASSTATNYATAVSNGTLALEAAFNSLKLDRGAEVLVTPRSFVASASAIIRTGLKPVFVDIDPQTQNISPYFVERAITSHTRAILCVHHGGWPCDMDQLTAIADRYKLRIVEDWAQAHGARYKGRPVGSLSDVAATSFCQDKIISTLGEGGAVTTDDMDIHEAVFSLKDHGKNEVLMRKNDAFSGYKWVHENVGSNFRLTEIQAASGLIQLSELDERVSKRNRNASVIYNGLTETPGVRYYTPTEDLKHAYYRIYLQIEIEKLKSSWTRNRIVGELNKLGLLCNVGSCPEIYKEMGFRAFVPAVDLKNAWEVGEASIALFNNHRLTDSYLQRVISGVKDVLHMAIR